MVQMDSPRVGLGRGVVYGLVRMRDSGTDRYIYKPTLTQLSVVSMYVPAVLRYAGQDNCRSSSGRRSSRRSSKESYSYCGITVGSGGEEQALSVIYVIPFFSCCMSLPFLLARGDPFRRRGVVEEVNLYNNSIIIERA